MPIYHRKNQPPGLTYSLVPHRQYNSRSVSKTSGWDRFYLRKKILNSTPTPLLEVLTISPVAIIELLVLGKLNFIAISCPVDKSFLVLIKTPLELTSSIGALNSQSLVLQAATIGWTSRIFFLTSFLSSATFICSFCKI